ncbi:hypothetical protein JDV09_07565 [Mycobacterium sp. Y57]|uniref:hypothetical protein n=1 Tax=Mycolicibacterium xanthum TaxID=2796469 RepID=UPI001C849C66|nr:hypothetical protein [Mycolicibacterium xanthum]MBX7431964.1 hypothetical protein [Mycolicibacterium xanthum]
MSRRSEQKTARRKKRRAGRDEAWIPAHVHQQLDIAAELEAFDVALTDRGWEYSEDADDEAGVAWYWPPSYAEVDDEDQQVAATVVLLSPDDGGEVAHVVFVGTDLDHQFGLDELFDHLDTIEAHRIGAPLPAFT